MRQTKLRQRDGSGLTNSRAANWAPEVEFSPFRALSRPPLTFSLITVSRHIHTRVAVNQTQSSILETTPEFQAVPLNGRPPLFLFLQKMPVLAKY